MRTLGGSRLRSHPAPAFAFHAHDGDVVLYEEPRDDVEMWVGPLCTTQMLRDGAIVNFSLFRAGCG